MQNRAKTGVDFEKSVQVNGWIKQTSSPRMKWSGDGRTIFDKIKSINYDPTRFILDETVDINKYDIYHPETKKYREVKKYSMESFNDWLLYSEPYFKMASKGLFNKMPLDIYNKFAEEFYELHKDSGLFERVIKKINQKSEGIQIIGGFIPKKELEFRTILIMNNWAGYHRITIQVKRK
jgi:hypothetical protein